MVGFARWQIEHTLTFSRGRSFKTHSSRHVYLAAEVGIKTWFVDRVCWIEKVRTWQVVIVDDLKLHRVFVEVVGRHHEVVFILWEQFWFRLGLTRLFLTCPNRAFPDGFDLVVIRAGHIRCAALSWWNLAFSSFLLDDAFLSVLIDVALKAVNNRWQRHKVQSIIWQGAHYLVGFVK